MRFDEKSLKISHSPFTPQLPLFDDEEEFEKDDLILRSETDYHLKYLVHFPIDVSLKVKKKKKKEEEILNRDEDLKMPLSRSSAGQSLSRSGRKTAKLSKKYDANLYAFGEKPEMPMEILSNWASETGILNLIDRSVVPPHVDVSPALKGTTQKEYLRNVKARMFPISLKTDHGSIWEQPRRVYLPALRLVPETQLNIAQVNQMNLLF